MIVIVILFLILLIIKSFPLIRKIKIIQPSIENINHNVEVSKRKTTAIQNKTKKTTGTINKIIKYGLLSKIILTDFKQQEKKSVGSFAKAATRGFKKQNEKQILKKLTKHQFNTN
jgi:predicted Holliday junction resolvase-like endonuclease